MKKDEMTKEYIKLCNSYKKKYKEEEIWKPVIIDGITTPYVVSNYGRVYNIDDLEVPRVFIYRNHYRVALKLDNKSYKIIGTYRLVGMMFIDIPKKYIDMGYTMDTLIVDHKRDGDPDNFEDNTVWNLQWLTHRENISKASNCGFRPAYEVEFRDELDKMILDDCSNDDIYDMCYNKYGYSKDEIKAMVQVRRRRLGKTLKEHYENDKEFVNQIDKLLKDGLSNDEIIDKLNMSREGRASGRLLQYRRQVLKIPANKSKYLSNDDNERLTEMIKAGMKNKDIIKELGLDKLSDDGLKKINATISSRRTLYKKQEKLINGLVAL